MDFIGLGLYFKGKKTEFGLAEGSTCAGGWVWAQAAAGAGEQQGQGQGWQQCRGVIPAGFV